MHLVLRGNKAGNACSCLVVHNHLEERAAAAAGAGALWSQRLHRFQLTLDQPSPRDSLRGGKPRRGEGCFLWSGKEQQRSKVKK